MASSSTRSSARSSAANQLKLLPKSFYQGNSIDVAQLLLGKIVRINAGGAITSGRIVETEAYRRDDPACHAYQRETGRAANLYGEPGVAYVYFIYGMYEMLNFVTEPKGEPGAVLIRAIEPLSGIEAMFDRRPAAKTERDLGNGPGKLCVAMGVDLKHNGLPLTGPEIAVYDDGFRPDEILESPRIGISQATDFYWRYFIAGHPCVGRAKENKLARPVQNRPRPKRGGDV